MWETVTLNYQINTSSDIIMHGKRLRTLHVEGPKVQYWWKEVHTTAQNLQPGGKSTSLVDLGYIKKASTLGINSTWTANINVPARTPKYESKS
jgi:hypothetical protein